MRIRERLDGWRQDMVYAARTIAREPGFSAVIVMTLALGIGANATMFGLLDRLLLRGPEYAREPDRLMRFYLSAPSFGGVIRSTSSLGYAAYAAFREDTRSLEGAAAYSGGTGTVGFGEDAEEVRTGAATWTFFDLIGVRPLLGRFFTADEDRPPDGANVVVIGEALWRRRFGSDPGVIGETLVVGEEQYTIIGVAPRGFTGVELQRVDTWIPMAAQSRYVRHDWPTAWNAQWLQVVGRLRPGVTVEEAAAGATRAFRQAYTGGRAEVEQVTVTLAPLRYNRQGREPLEFTVSRWLIAVTTIVLLIACANVTNLLLARASRRQRETAVRLAMGIGRSRLVRLHLLHGILLALSGGVMAVLITRIAGPIAQDILLPTIDWSGAAVNGRVLLFTGLIAGGSGILTALVPAMRAGRQDLIAELKTGLREGGGRTRWVRTTLTIVQVTLSVVLLVAAGLFTRSLATARAVDLGFQPDRVLAVEFRWPRFGAQPGSRPGELTPADRARRRQFAVDALERFRAMPGVGSAAVAVGTPFQSSFTVTVRATDWDSIPEFAGSRPHVSAVTGGFFETLGMHIVEGRTFTDADRAGSEPVTIVNETMARGLWPDGSAIGKCVYAGEDQAAAPCFRVVGIIGDAHRFGLRESPAMQYYIPRGQEADFSGDVLLIRPRSMDDTALIDELRKLAISLDPGLSYVQIQSLQDRVDPEVRPWKLGASLFTLFGALALIIAAIGLYSVIAYGVAARRHEMGVRMALGALARDVVIMVARQAAVLTLAGLTIGGVLALLAGRFIQSALFDVSPRDPSVFITVFALMLIVAILAAALPARRAARVNPVIALRAD